MNTHNQQLYDLAKDYGISKETINECGANLTPKQFIDFRAVFDYIDLDKSGDIDIDEFVQVFGRMKDEHKLTKHDIHKFLKNVDKDNNGSLDFEGFLKIMTGSLSLQFNKNDLQEAFQKFSEQGKNRHLVDVEKLRMTLKHLFSIIGDDDNKINKNEIDNLLQLLPVSQDGFLNIKSFLDSVM